MTENAFPANFFNVKIILAPLLIPPVAFLAAQHGEIIESSYLLGEKGPKSTWTKVLEMVILLATVGGCAYLFLFLFHHGNHHPAPAKDSASHPHTPVGASSSASPALAACDKNPGCAKLGERGGAKGLACSARVWSLVVVVIGSSK